MFAVFINSASFNARLTNGRNHETSQLAETLKIGSKPGRHVGNSAPDERAPQSLKGSSTDSCMCYPRKDRQIRPRDAPT